VLIWLLLNAAAAIAAAGAAVTLLLLLLLAFQVAHVTCGAADGQICLIGALLLMGCSWVEPTPHITDSACLSCTLAVIHLCAFAVQTHPQAISIIPAKGCCKS
jgi:hypothetical protein